MKRTVKLTRETYQEVITELYKLFGEHQKWEPEFEIGSTRSALDDPEGKPP